MSSSLIGLYYRVCHTASLSSTLHGGGECLYLHVVCTVHLCTGCSILCIHRILCNKSFCFKSLCYSDKVCTRPQGWARNGLKSNPSPL